MDISSDITEQINQIRKTFNQSALNYDYFFETSLHHISIQKFFQESEFFPKNQQSNSQSYKNDFELKEALGLEFLPNNCFEIISLQDSHQSKSSSGHSINALNCLMNKLLNNPSIKKSTFNSLAIRQSNNENTTYLVV